jgi:hypothetical protein
MLNKKTFMNRAVFQHVLLFVLATVWGCACANDRASWIQGNHVAVALSWPKTGDHERYELWMAGPGDARIEEVKEVSGKHSAGSILLVGGRFLALHDIEARRGMEIDEIDIPALYWQLAAQLLERVIPNGPGPTIPTDELKVSEPTKGLEVGTMSASGEYGAPWTVSANVSRDASGIVHYELDFQCTDPESGKPSPPMKLSGVWEHQQPAPKIADDQSLVGWKLFSLGPVSGKTKDGTILDYSSSSLEKTAKTVGDLRALAGK